MSFYGLVGIVWMLFGASFSSFYGCLRSTVGLGFKRTQGPADQGDQRTSNFIVFPVSSLFQRPKND